MAIFVIHVKRIYSKETVINVMGFKMTNSLKIKNTFRTHPYQYQLGEFIIYFMIVWVN